MSTTLGSISSPFLAEWHKRRSGWVSALLITLALILVSRVHFLWFHTLAEIFAVLVGVALYVIARNSYVLTRNNYLLLLAEGFFWVASIDVMHTLSYKGMGLVPGNDPNPATQLWILARYLEALVLLLAPSWLGGRTLPKWSFAAIGVVASLGMASIYLGWFPDAFVKGHGLTPFKIWSEYLIIAILATAAARLYRQRGRLDPSLLRTMLLVIGLTMLSEFAFTLYVHVYGFSNVVGHIAKFWAFGLLLAAVSRWMLAHPFRLLARDAGSFESIPVPVLVLNTNGVIQSSNHAARQCFPNGGVGQTLHDAWHADNRPMQECPVCQALARGQAIQSELHDTEHNAWAQVTLQPIQRGHTLHGFVCVHDDITARKRSELAQRASDARLRTVLENAADAIFVIHRDGQIHYANRQAEELVGFDHSEILSRGYQSLVVPEHHDKAAQALQEVLRNGHDRLEIHLLHRDGHALPVEVNAVLLPDGSIYGACRDISERVLAARRLAEQGALLRRIIDSIPDLIFYKDNDSVYLGCNTAFECYFGHQEAEIRGKTDFDFVDHATASFYRKMDQQMLQGGVPRINEEWITYPDGRRSLLETLKTPYHDHDGRLLGLIGIARDITARREAEEMAHANERRYRALFDHMLEGFAHCRLIFDDQGRPVDFVYLDVNSKFSEITGLHDVVGKRVTDVLPGIHDTNPELFEHYAHVAATGQPERFEVHVPGIDKWLMLSVYSFEPEHFSVVFDNISDRKHYEQQLEHQANHDPLTGLANRNLLTDRLQQALAFADRRHRQVATLLLDLDRFKRFNDGMGHALGDELLCAVAERLAASVRPGDTVARLGGDEFLVVMSDMSAEGNAAELATRILHDLERPMNIAGREVVVTASLGVALYPRDGTDPTALLKNVDVAMYRAKELGGNCLQFYSPEMNSRILDRLDLEMRLRFAIAQNELVLFYQPQVDLRSGVVSGAEALIRWQHPELGFMPPGEFIPLAEESGLIVGIGEWVIDTACAQIKAWNAEGLPDIQVSVNVSARQFQHEQLVSVVKAALQRHSVRPQQLEVEVTESAVMRDPDYTAVTLQKLKQLGVHIALDDFGTGYSSLNYLKRFPIDQLKIDKSFVNDLTTDPDDAAIALSVISLAHSLNRQVIAEGVETEAQLAFLRRHGCDAMQGYLFARPMPAGDLAQLLAEGRKLVLPPDPDQGDDSL